MNRSIALIALLQASLLCSASGMGTVFDKDLRDLRKAKEQLVDFYANRTADWSQSQARKWVADVDARAEKELNDQFREPGHSFDGCFGDHYTEYRGAGYLKKEEWFPAPNYMRAIFSIHALGRAYASPASRYHKDPKLVDSVVAGLGFLYRHFYNPKDGFKGYNWYNRDIALPRSVLPCLIAMESALPAETAARQKELFQYLCQSEKTSAAFKAGTLKPYRGYNACDMACSLWRTALFVEDTGAAEAARWLIEESLDNNPEGREGIRPDYSYFFHGRRIYIAYAGSHVSAMSEYEFATRNTKYALHPKPRATFYTFLNKFYFPAIFHGTRDYLTYSEISRYDAINGYHYGQRAENTRGLLFTAPDAFVDSILHFTEECGLDSLTSPLGVQQYHKLAAKRPEQGSGYLPVTQYYWEGAYALCRGNDYFASVKLPYSTVKQGQADANVYSFMVGTHHTASGNTLDSAILNDPESRHRLPGATYSQSALERFQGLKKEHSLRGFREHPLTIMSGTVTSEGAVRGQAVACGTAVQIGRSDTALSCRKSWFLFPKGMLFVVSNVEGVDERIFTTVDIDLLQEESAPHLKVDGKAFPIPPTGEIAMVAPRETLSLNGRISCFATETPLEVENVGDRFVTVQHVHKPGDVLAVWFPLDPRAPREFPDDIEIVECSKDLHHVRFGGNLDAFVLFRDGEFDAFNVSRPMSLWLERRGEELHVFAPSIPVENGVRHITLKKPHAERLFLNGAARPIPETGDAELSFWGKPTTDRTIQYKFPSVDFERKTLNAVVRCINGTGNNVPSMEIAGAIVGGKKMKIFPPRTKTGVVPSASFKDVPFAVTGPLNGPSEITFDLSASHFSRIESARLNVLFARENPVQVDGKLSDWSSLKRGSIDAKEQVCIGREEWSNASQLSGTFAVCRDKDRICIAIEITDPTIAGIPAEKDGSIFYCDGIEVYFSELEARGKPNRAYQLALAIPEGGDGPALTFSRWAWMPEGIDSMCSRTDNGYIIELSVPLNRVPLMKIGPHFAGRFDIGINGADKPYKRNLQMVWSGDENDFLRTGKYGYLFVE